MKSREVARRYAEALYRLAREQGQVAQVEAGSPQEAVVKFRHTRPGAGWSGPRAPEILSVSPDPVCDELSW